MRRVAAIACIVAFATFAGVDPVWCPDGCRDTADWSVATATHGAAPATTCPLCLSSVNTPVPTVSATPIRVSAAFDSPKAGTIPLAPATSIDHPPRTS